MGCPHMRHWFLSEDTSRSDTGYGVSPYASLVSCGVSCSKQHPRAKRHTHRCPFPLQISVAARDEMQAFLHLVCAGEDVAGSVDQQLLRHAESGDEPQTQLVAHSSHASATLVQPSLNTPLPKP